MDTTTRIAIIDIEKCKPKKCDQECKKKCPVVSFGKKCIEISTVANIYENLCTGCGICVKKCPFEAIKIINLPKNLDKDTVHRYSNNSFKLHRLPVPRVGQVLGLIGRNGIGKSTTIKILSGKILPNLGLFDEKIDEKDILKYFRGSELQNYFTKLIENNYKTSLKPQYVDLIPRKISGTVRELLEKQDTRGIINEIMTDLDLNNISDTNIESLSGGELQRFAIAATIVTESKFYMFDEPSSYLDVKQRINAARIIRKLLDKPDTYIITIDHDLAVQDYLSDYICVLYGEPGAYGVVTSPFSVREGINIFLDGYIPTENIRFRKNSLSFKIYQGIDDKTGSIPNIYNDEISSETLLEVINARKNIHKYPKMTKTLGSFNLTVEAGEYRDAEIIVMLGENGTGKTTFIRMLAGLLKSDLESEQTEYFLNQKSISYKPQKISPKFEGTVQELFIKKKIKFTQQFESEIMKPLLIESLLDQQVQNLSGDELQRVAITLCLGTPADIYLIDEPSAYLDSEQRIACCKIIKKFILSSKKTAFIVEHDFIMATYLADRVIVYEKQQTIVNEKQQTNSIANVPESLLTGMNKFLESLELTFRRDSISYRPRINKFCSTKDTEQKKNGQYFFID